MAAMSAWLVIILLGISGTLIRGQFQQFQPSLTQAQSNSFLAGNNLLQSSNNFALDAATANALASANAAQLSADNSRNLLEQQQAAQTAANFATAQASARQAAVLARNQANAVRVMMEQMQREAAEEAAAEAARARVAAVQAIINAQTAVSEAGETAIEAEMIFRGQFPGWLDISVVYMGCQG